MIIGDDGRFMFRDLPSGRYRLVATRTGEAYAPVEYGQRDPRGKVFRSCSGDGQRLENIELPMAPTGSISGRIFDGDGGAGWKRSSDGIGSTPIATGKKILTTIQAVRSNDLGEYRLVLAAALPLLRRG